MNTLCFMKKGLISEKMLEEHGKMLKLLGDFMKNKKDSFENLKEIQGRHAYSEEQAIFIFYKDKKNFKLMSTILEQHEQLHEYMGKMENDKALAKKFETLMKDHIKLEDKEFYPMLDKDLLPEEQKKILTRFDVLMG